MMKPYQLVLPLPEFEDAIYKEPQAEEIVECAFHVPTGQRSFDDYLTELRIQNETVSLKAIGEKDETYRGTFTRRKSIGQTYPLLPDFAGIDNKLVIGTSFLGSGALSDVYSGRYEGEPTDSVAIKIAKRYGSIAEFPQELAIRYPHLRNFINYTSQVTGNALGAFDKEAEVLQRLTRRDSKHIPRFHNYHRSSCKGDAAYLIMESARGRRLSDYDWEESIGEITGLRIGCQLVETMILAGQEGFVYTDWKSSGSNLFWDVKGQNLTITDWNTAMSITDPLSRKLAEALPGNICSELYAILTRHGTKPYAVSEDTRAILEKGLQNGYGNLEALYEGFKGQAELAKSKFGVSDLDVCRRQVETCIHDGASPETLDKALRLVRFDNEQPVGANVFAAVAAIKMYHMSQDLYYVRLAKEHIDRAYNMAEELERDVAIMPHKGPIDELHRMLFKG